MDQEIEQFKNEYITEYNKYKSNTEIGEITADAMAEILNGVGIKCQKAIANDHYDIITEHGLKIEMKHCQTRNDKNYIPLTAIHITDKEYENYNYLIAVVTAKHEGKIYFLLYTKEDKIKLKNSNYIRQSKKDILDINQFAVKLKDYFNLTTSVKDISSIIEKVSIKYDLKDLEGRNTTLLGNIGENFVKKSLSNNFPIKSKTAENGYYDFKIITEDSEKMFDVKLKNFDHSSNHKIVSYNEKIKKDVTLVILIYYKENIYYLFKEYVKNIPKNISNYKLLSSINDFVKDFKYYYENYAV